MVKIEQALSHSHITGVCSVGVRVSMLRWLIPAGTHLRIGTLLNSLSPTTSLLSDSSSPDRLVDDPPALSEAEGSLSDSDSRLSDSSLLGILRKEENYEV